MNRPTEIPTQKPAAALHEAASDPQPLPLPAPPRAPYSPTMVAPDPRRKSPLLAMVLSFLPGVGQVYVGYYQQGFMHAIVFAVLVAVLSADRQLGSFTPTVAIFMAFFFLFNVIDAGRRATLYNLALAGGEPVHLPSEFKMPGLGGSLAGGALLLVVGFLLLLKLQFGVSLDWIRQWWPAGLMMIGAYLMVQAVRERRAAKTAASDSDV